MASYSALDEEDAHPYGVPLDAMARAAVLSDGANLGLLAAGDVPDAGREVALSLAGLLPDGPVSTKALSDLAKGLRPDEQALVAAEATLARRTRLSTGVVEFVQRWSEGTNAIFAITTDNYVTVLATATKGAKPNMS